MKLTAKSLKQIILEVITEDEGDEAQEFIQSLIDSKDISNLIYGLSVVEDLDDGGALTYGQGRLLKVMMFNSIIENDLAISDISGAIEFISSKEFSISFTEPALENFREKLFRPLIDTKLKELIEYVTGGLRSYDESWGDKMVYSIREVPNQEFIDEVVQKFSQMTGNPRFAVGAYDGDNFHIFVGKYAMEYVSFNKDVKSIFGFDTAGEFPLITKWADGGIQLYQTEGMEGPGTVNFKKTSSPLHNGEEVEFKISYEFDNKRGWELLIKFEDPFDDVKVGYYPDHDGYVVWVRSVRRMNMGSKEEMLKLVQDTTGIDLTNVERI